MERAEAFREFVATDGKLVQTVSIQDAAFIFAMGWYAGHKEALRERQAWLEQWAKNESTMKAIDTDLGRIQQILDGVKDGEV